MATTAITSHHARLKQHGLDLGAAQGAEQDAGFGGRVQTYERGRIYWHQSAGAHALHGPLLQRYIGAGGHEINPATGERELGFPTSDHIRTDDGRFERVTFEWGTIDDVSGTTGVRLFGTLYQAWRSQGGTLGRLGHPLDDVARIEGGRAAWFERGVLWHAEGSTEVLAGVLAPPMLGQPALVNPEAPGAFEWMSFDGAVTLLDARPGLPAALMAKRLSLTPVGGGEPIGLVPAAGITPRGEERWLTFDIEGSGGGTGRRRRVVGLEGSFRRADEAATADRLTGGGSGGSAAPTLPAPGQLARRQLYSLAFHTPGLGPRTIAPHCLYARGDWENFGVAHVTDVHVSRRIEAYRAKLRATGVAESDVAQLDNWNDAFRDFIRYANHLHAAGRLDVIIATGDLVDYTREVDDHPQGPGNFGFFEALVQGQAPGRDAESPASEALRVPIFTSLGNHDYRELPYPLGFDLKVTTGDVVSAIPILGNLLQPMGDVISFVLDKVPGLGLLLPLDVVDLVSSFQDTMWSHAGLNTTQEEALQLMGLTIDDGATYLAPRLRPGAAARAVQVDASMRDGTHYYFKRINPTRSYIVPLGRHRIVMLDTRWDEGITSTVDDAALTKLGFGTESQENFLGGSPDSVGAKPAELEMLRTALQQAGEHGLVIVGMHAPPLNPHNTELPNCFRESVHPTSDPVQVTGFLMRCVPGELMRTESSPIRLPRPDVDSKRPGWPRTGTPHFHTGPVEDLLDHGIAVGEQEALAELIAGKDALRPATLVCCGHGHTRVEFRLRWDTDHDQLETYTDHYLGNPDDFYPMNLVEGDWWKPGQHKRYLVRIKPGAPAGGTVQQIRDGRGTIWPDLSEIHVPPYPAPLADASNPTTWWQAHSPVVAQTAALGPCANQRPTLKVNEHPPKPNFQGFRVMQVIDNVIARSHYVTMPELRGAIFPLPWEVGDAPVGPVTPPPIAPTVTRETTGPNRRRIRDHREG